MATLPTITEVLEWYDTVTIEEGWALNKRYTSLFTEAAGNAINMYREAVMDVLPRDFAEHGLCAVVMWKRIIDSGSDLGELERMMADDVVETARAALIAIIYQHQLTPEQVEDLLAPFEYAQELR